MLKWLVGGVDVCIPFWRKIWHFVWAGETGWPQDLSRWVDDEVLILKGGNFPFLPRGKEDGGFKLVGECYVHGFKIGERIDEGMG
jgi:hypothetical protein